MKGNNPQAGRSLTEMLATLAIMGVLTITAIAGVTYAINRQRANQIIHDARVGYYDEYGAENPHMEWFRIKPLETDRPMWVFRDKLGRIYVKAEKVNKDVCWHVLRMAAENILSFYNTDNTEMTSCPAEENAIIIAFNGASAPAECAVYNDCPEGFNGYCSTDGRCTSCDDKSERLNETRTGCECDSDFALSCTSEGKGWCCGYDEEDHPLICGRNPGECIDPKGACWMNVQKRGPSQKNCVYVIGDGAISCANTVSMDGSEIVLQDVAGQACTEANTYCYLGYTDETHTTPVDTDFSEGILYGTCLSVEDFDEISPSTLSAEGDDCQSGEYCLLNYTDANRSEPITDTFTTGKLYGICLSVEYYEEINPDSFDTGNLDEEQSCPAGYYCSLAWTDSSCGTGIGSDFTTGTLYGACLKLDDFHPVCPGY